MMESDVSEGEGSALGDAIVEYSLERTEIEEARGFSGVTGRECCRYQTNTIVIHLDTVSTQARSLGEYLCDRIWRDRS